MMDMTTDMKPDLLTVMAIIYDHVTGIDEGQVKIAVDTIDGKPPYISEVLTYSDFCEHKTMANEVIEKKINEFCESPSAGSLVVSFNAGKMLYASFMKIRKGDSKKKYVKFCREMYKCKFAQNAEKKSDTLRKIVIVSSSAKLKKQQSIQNLETKEKAILSTGA